MTVLRYSTLIVHSTRHTPVDYHRRRNEVNIVGAERERQRNSLSDVTLTRIRTSEDSVCRGSVPLLKTFRNETPLLTVHIPYNVFNTIYMSKVVETPIDTCKVAKL